MPALAVALLSAAVTAHPAAAAPLPLIRVAAKCHIMIDDVCKVRVAETAPSAPKGGNGGNGGSVYYNFYLGSPTAGNGGNGGAVKMSPSGSGVSSSAPALSAPAVPVNLVLRKCKLTIGGAPVVDAKGCQYNQLGQQFTLTAPSENLKYTYTIKVAWDDQKIGSGTLAGGRTAKVRDLGVLTRRGACWVKSDETVEICAWK